MSNSLEDDLFGAETPFSKAMERVRMLEVENDRLRTALQAMTDEVKQNCYSPGCEHMGPLVMDAEKVLGPGRKHEG